MAHPYSVADAGFWLRYYSSESLLFIYQQWELNWFNLLELHFLHLQIKQTNCMIQFLIDKACKRFSSRPGTEQVFQNLLAPFLMMSWHVLYLCDRFSARMHLAAFIRVQLGASSENLQLRSDQGMVGLPWYPRRSLLRWEHKNPLRYGVITTPQMSNLRLSHQEIYLRSPS